MKRQCFASISLLILILTVGCVHPHINRGSVGIRTDNMQVRVGFGDHDRRIINDYYGRANVKQNKLPPGLAKKGKLTPGHKKQLMKNKKLPYGIAKRSLPGELERRLSPLPRGYVRLKVGSDIVLMNKKTGFIIDIIYDIG